MTIKEEKCLRSIGNPEEAAKCVGVVAGWESTTTMIYECEYHTRKSIEFRQGVRERYPDSPIPPSDFDPTYAGERWDDDY